MDRGCEHSKTGHTKWERGTAVLRRGLRTSPLVRSEEQKCSTALKLIRLHLVEGWIDAYVSDPWSRQPLLLWLLPSHRCAVLTHAHLRVFSVL